MLHKMTKNEMLIDEKGIFINSALKWKPLKTGRGQSFRCERHKQCDVTNSIIIQDGVSRPVLFGCHLSIHRMQQKGLKKHWNEEASIRYPVYILLSGR